MSETAKSGGGLFTPSPGFGLLTRGPSPFPRPYTPPGPPLPPGPVPAEIFGAATEGVPPGVPAMGRTLTQLAPGIALPSARPGARSAYTRAANAVWRALGWEPTWTDHDMLEEIVLWFVPVPPGLLHGARGARASRRVAEAVYTPTFTAAIAWTKQAVKVLRAKSGRELVQVIRWCNARPGGAFLEWIFRGERFEKAVLEAYSRHPRAAKAAILAYLKAERFVSIFVVKNLVPTLTGGVAREVGQGTQIPFIAAAFGRTNEEVDALQETFGDAPDLAFEILWAESPVPLPESSKKDARKAWRLLLEKLQGR